MLEAEEDLQDCIEALAGKHRLPDQVQREHTWGAIPEVKQEALDPSALLPVHRRGHGPWLGRRLCDELAPQ